MDFDATQTPVDVVSALGLEAGTTYSGQNVSNTSTLFVREVATVPDITDRAFRIEAGSSFRIRPDGRLSIWIWTDESAGCPVILGDSV